MSIFWTFSTWFGDGSGQFWWTITYERQSLDVTQSGFAVKKNAIRFDMIWMKRSSSELVFVLSVRSLAVSSQLCLCETIGYSVSNCFMNIKWKASLLMLKSTSAMPITQLRLSLVGFCDSIYQHFIHSCYLLMSASQWHCKHILIGDYFPNPDKRGSHYYRTCYDKAAYIISQAWLWSDS